jgi:hypothetical protein
MKPSASSSIFGKPRFDDPSRGSLLPMTEIEIGINERGLGPRYRALTGSSHYTVSKFSRRDCRALPSSLANQRLWGRDQANDSTKYTKVSIYLLWTVCS